MMVGMLFSHSGFYTAYNLLDMLNSTSILLILAFGVTLTIVSGGCDLSIGGTLVVSGIVAVKLLNVMPMWPGPAHRVAGSAPVGIDQRFPGRAPEDRAVHHHPGDRAPAGGGHRPAARPTPTPFRGNNPDFMNIGNGDFYGVPYLVIIMAVCFVASYALMRFTAFGRNLYAIGGDYEVRRVLGHQSWSTSSWRTSIKIPRNRR